jgi:UDP-N-acetylmuramoylalanine--D-glutamate ligase
VGGNLGTPALDLLDDNNDLYVLELSSFQLERTSILNAASATVLNISADHIDRHGDIAGYAKEKQKVFAGSGVMVLNSDDPLVIAMQDNNRDTLRFSIQHNNADFYLKTENSIEYLAYKETLLMPLSDLPLEGKHNAANALAALALGLAVGLNIDAMLNALKVFQGLAHRMNKVAVINSISWINDSKATNIGATIAALAGYTTPVILLAGGDGKGADMNELTPTIQEKCKAVILMGKDALLIEQAINNTVPSYHAENMQEAVRIANHLAKAGDTVLLSPACASLDQYKSYADRGNQFAEAVLALNTNAKL